MLAYHNDIAIKHKYIARVKKHRLADDLIHGVGWENGKGCAIGCTLHKYEHVEYETELGIPQMLARLEDCIFEGLENGAAQEWPEKFLSAIKPGADLSLVGWKFLYWLLAESKIGAFQDKSIRDAVNKCTLVIKELSKGKKIKTIEAESAESAAWSASWGAESAARSAARSAAWGAAWGAAWVKMSNKLLSLLKEAPVRNRR